MHQVKPTSRSFRSLTIDLKYHAQSSYREVIPKSSTGSTTAFRGKILQVPISYYEVLFETPPKKERDERKKGEEQLACHSQSIGRSSQPMVHAELP